MKGKLGKIGIMSLALVIALAGVGGVFAHWTETLTTEANVSTGCLQLKLTPDPIPCTDSEQALGLEDVAKISCTQTDGGPEYDFTEFTIAVTDAYPGYVGRVTFDVTNTGTIPASICCGTSIVFVPSWAKVHIDDVLVFNTQPMMPGESYQDRYIEVEIPAPGDNCPENASFSFTLEIEAAQWNAP